MKGTRATSSRPLALTKCRGLAAGSVFMCSIAASLSACGDRPMSPADGGSTSAAESSEASGSDGGDEGSQPPDVGTDAVVCGEPGENAASEEEIALLEGCELYQGGIVILLGNDLSSLSSLRVVREEFAGGGQNEDLQSLHGLEQLEWVGSFYFSGNALQDLTGAGNLRDVDDLFRFFSMPNLTDFTGLEELRTVGGKFSLEINPELTSLEGLSGLEWIGGELYIVGNDKLQSLEGLSALQRVEGDVTIRLNEQLPAADIDDFLGRVEIGGSVHLD